MTTLVYLYYFKFNNYYNRQLKIKQTLNEYTSITGALVGNTACKVNFNPGDQINTTQVVNDENIINADYLLTVDDTNTIISRWFITEAKRNLKGQWNLTLKRDVLADNWSAVKYSPMFVERAILPENNNLIFNSENSSLNQIKTSEHELKDDSNCAWIIGYLDRKYGKDKSAAERTLEFENVVVPDYSTTTTTAFKETYIPHTNWNTYYIGRSSFNSIKLKMTCQDIKFWIVGNLSSDRIRFEWSIVYNRTDEDVGFRVRAVGETFQQAVDQVLTALNATPKFTPSYWIEQAGMYITDTQYNTQLSEITSVNGKYLNTTTDDKDYRLTATLGSDNRSYDVQTDISSYNLYSQIYNRIITFGTVNQPWYYVNFNFAKYRIVYEEVITGTYQIIMPEPQSRYTLKDAPYDMFCIPYGDFTLRYNNNDLLTRKSAALSFAQGIAKGLDANLYDLQLVPYCPMTGYTYDSINNKLNFGSIDAKRYSLINKSGSPVTGPYGIIFWATASNKTFDINYSIPVTNKKMENECDMYRLCSPNFSGQFEFSAAKNNGISKFNVDITYLPYQPYIHINPDFSNLYGSDFNDARGLICGGDFSISYLKDAWESYKVQNKNYQAIFDRQIENMDYNHKYDMLESGISAIAGIGTGAAAGAVTGGTFGPIGAAVGAVAGGVASAAGGIADQYINEAKYQESKSYATDNFNLQLGNVQALPQSLTKVTAYNYNNKIFPIIEYYTCTEDEKDALADKICYNSMTVGKIGTINDFLLNTFTYGDKTDKGFIRGRLIRFIGADDSHLANEVASRLAEGVYTK